MERYLKVLYRKFLNFMQKSKKAKEVYLSLSESAAVSPIGSN